MQSTQARVCMNSGRNCLFSASEQLKILLICFFEARFYSVAGLAWSIARLALNLLQVSFSLCGTVITGNFSMYQGVS